MLNIPIEHADDVNKLFVIPAAPNATLTPLSCSPNFPRAQYLDIRTLTHELIVNLYKLNKTILTSIQPPRANLARLQVAKYSDFEYYEIVHSSVYLVLLCLLIGAECQTGLKGKNHIFNYSTKREVLAHIEFMLRVRQRNQWSPVITVTFTVLR